MKNNKWFTLVELVVVIVVLAILWTIWFVSYSWQVITARDAQRKSDITMINNSIKKVSLQWADLRNWFLLNSSNKWTWTGKFFMKWQDLLLAWSFFYDAWDINLNNLQDVSNKLSDPKTKTSYKIWIFEQNYEVACTLEERNISYVIWIDKKRTSSWTISTISNINIVNNSFELSNFNDTLKFQSWDIIWTWSTWVKYTIDTIVWNTIYLTGTSLSWWLNNWNNIMLYSSDTWLIWNYKNWTVTSVTLSNCTNPWVILTLSWNLCPVINDEYLQNLIPYKVKQ